MRVIAEFDRDGGREVVLVTGVSRFLGGRLAAALAADPAVGRVIGIDTAPPRTQDLPLLGRTEFVRADIRNPLIARVVTQAGITTVVHAALTASPRSTGGRTPMQETNVIGTMQLLAACQKSTSVRRVVVQSAAAVYGCGPGEPAVLTEDMPPMMLRPSGFAKDAAEVESYVRGFARRRPDIRTTILRYADVVGPTVDSTVTRYLSMPVVPTALGFDPRLQLLHEDDAVEVLRLATVSPRPGVFNVAAEGVMPLSQMLRRANRARLPVPRHAIGLAGSLLRNAAVAEFAAEQAGYLLYGRAVDTTRLRDEFGYAPRYSTVEALDTFLERRLASRRPLLAAVEAGQRLVTPRPSRDARPAIGGA